MHDLSKGIKEIIVVLSQGDITKQDAIRWKYTLQDCELFLKYHKRQILFRESVIALTHWAMGIKDKDMEQSYYLAQYCVACKKSGKADCKICDKKLTISKERKNG